MLRIFLEDLYLPLLWISCLCGLVVYFEKNTGYWLKIFPPFLLITAMVETVGAQLSDRNINNVLLYNIYSLIEVPFYLIVLRAITKDRIAKIIIAYGAGLYVIIKTVDLLLLTPTVFHFMIYNLGAVLIITFCVYYFYRLYKETRFSRFVYDPAFWVCASLTIYFAGSLPIWVLFGFLQRFSLAFKMRTIQIHLFLNLAMYSLFIVAFLCTIKIRKSVT